MAPDKLNILFVEHDPDYARYVGEMLGQMRELRADLVVVPDLSSALLAIERTPVDLVVMDLGLPDGAGLGSISLVLAQSPWLPVVVVGDTDDEIIAVEAVHAGARDYLVKGQLTPAWLERSLNYALERQRLDAAVRAAQEKYHDVFDHLVEGIFQTSPDGRYRMANAALARIYGYNSPDDLILGLTDIGRILYVQPGRRDEFIRLMQENDTISGFESQVYRKDGTVIWISENCRAIRDRQGRLLHYEGTVEDITQRRQAEENLRNSEALYHSLVETLPQNIFRKDLEGRFTFGNQQFCRTLNRTLEEICGKTDFDFFPRDLAAKYQRDDRRVLETGQPYETVEEHQPPGQSKMYVQVVKTPLRDASGTPFGLQGIFWDITQQRLADEKLRRVIALLTQSRKELRARNLEMQDDLAMAREIQMAMLPQQYPAFPRSPAEPANTLEFTHRYLPAGSVGGDFFTVSALSDCEAGVFICDVAGHGVRAALVTAMVRALAEELKSLAGDPGQFMTKLNADLHSILRHSGTPLLTTGFYMVMNWRTGQVRYANAGHPKPLLLSRDSNEVRPLANASGFGQPALGLFEAASYTSSQATLQPGDLVVLFTDGLYEVQNRRDELYTQAMLTSAVRSRVQLPAAALFDELLAEIGRFAEPTGFTDDVCLVGMELARPV